MKRLPADVQRHLRDKFPNTPELESIVDALFNEISEKTFNDGSCSVQKFGTFYCYKAYSSRKGKFVPRFKFKISRAFMNSILDDDYILQRIEKVMNRSFSDDKKNNSSYGNIRNLNVKNQDKILNNQRKVREKTEEHVVQDEILKILEGEPIE